MTGFLGPNHKEPDGRRQLSFGAIPEKSGDPRKVALSTDLLLFCAGMWLALSSTPVVKLACSCSVGQTLEAFLKRMCLRGGALRISLNVRLKEGLGW
jgi:hypothetical protein